MHDIGIVLTREDVAGSAHIGGELVDLIDPFDGIGHDLLIAEVADDELISGEGEYS